MSLSFIEAAGFTWECTNCGVCCFGNWYERDGITKVMMSFVKLDDEDVKMLCNHLGMSEAEFMTKYQWSGDAINITGGRCPFYDDELKCTVQDCKPSYCARWPNDLDLDVELYARRCPGFKRIETNNE